MLYLDNAATTIDKPDCVARAVVEAMRTAGNASRGVNEASLNALRIVTETRTLLAELFHFATPNRVCFAANATEALNTAIMGMFEKGDHVITTVMEHNSVLRPLYRLQDAGIIELTVVRADEKGRIAPEQFEEAIKDTTKCILCAHGSNLTGNVMDLYALGQICRAHRILLAVDAAQTAGVIPIDMEKMNIAVLCFTGHKGLMGPQGTGGLCVREDVEIRPLKVGGSGIHSYDREHPRVYPEALEAGTQNVHGIAGLRAALLYLREQGIRQICEKEMLLARRFYEGVHQIEGVRVYGDFSCWENPGAGEKLRTGIVTINLGDYDSAQVSDELMERFSIATRAGAHCAPLAHETLGTVAQGAVRFSFSHRNTIGEVDAAIEAVRTLATE